jgi:hypothetical protein
VFVPPLWWWLVGVGYVGVPGGAGMTGKDEWVTAKIGLNRLDRI